jgi:quercetin 2,3-dioxygenase
MSEDRSEAAMGGMGGEGPVVCTFPLGFQWPVVDPFLFCVHHHDFYPAANERFGPAASLDGRDIGQDFEGVDGWRMYHGETVPGFPRHPHRGFETVTFVRQGLVDHSDSTGATARYGRGDVQWMTAGAGIVHAEMFPLLDQDAPNTVELFQIWVNLPAADKMVAPHFAMFWNEDVPRHVSVDDGGRRTEVTVVAGSIGDVTPLPPPPNSWASTADAEVVIWQLSLEPGAEFTLPSCATADVSRVLYVYEGTVTVGPREVTAPTAAVVHANTDVVLRAGATAAQCLMLQGRAIGEPVAQHGPFVMNDREGIMEAFTDYQRTGFGGWPWPADDPVHGAEAGRFARHTDGRVETAGARATT